MDQEPSASSLAPHELTIDNFLLQMLEMHASDLHLRVGLPPMARVHGHLVPLESRYSLDQETMGKILSPLLNAETLARYEVQKSLDTAYEIPGNPAQPGPHRFRVALFIQQSNTGGVFRTIPSSIPTLDDLGSPAILKKFAAAPRGIVIITGPTGSGKSTTLAATINEINETRRNHILTIEEPIEFVHQCKHCVINQREVPRDTPSFIQGLDDGLREDPDVILLGELRGLDTMQTALKAAETGHLVFATLHTSSAPSSIDRLVDSFPDGEQNQIKTMIAGSLLGIVAQTLLPTIDGKGRVAAYEILVVDAAVSNMIRNGRTESIRNELVTKSNIGMLTMDTSLAHLVSIGKVSEAEARSVSQLPEEFDDRMRSARSGIGFMKPDLLGMEGSSAAPVSTQ